MATGPRSEIGKIGQSLHALETEPPRLQVQTARLVRLAALGGAAVSVVAVLLYGTLRGGWLDAVLAGIAIGMSMLPEEFPVVLTVFMAMGAWRISKARVLTRRAAAIETLGSATVLCTDKTGTLTENRMSIAELRLRTVPSSDCAKQPMPPCPAISGSSRVHGLLASAPEPFDPMEKAFHAFARDGLETADGLPASRLETRAQLRVATRSSGHDPALAKRHGHARLRGCGEGRPRSDRPSMPSCDLRNWQPCVMRSMPWPPRACACWASRKPSMRGSAGRNRSAIFRLRFSASSALPIRCAPSVPDAVRECRSAGIRVVMITGDYPATARAIAQQAGLDAAEVLTGDAIERLDDSELARRAQTTSVFARIMPEQKLRIVQALKADGEIVAMTGDGVNDAPSLKAAHIGVAMGGRGTDVAREASSIVLLDDDFGSIVTAIRLGRRIYDNVRKAMGFIFAVHVPIAGLALLPLVFGLPIIFSPIHIAFLEMVIDPVCSLVFEAETDEEDVMRRKPRAPDEPLFSWPLVGWSVLQGGLAFGLVGTIFVIAHRNAACRRTRCGRSRSSRWCSRSSVSFWSTARSARR